MYSVGGPQPTFSQAVPVTDIVFQCHPGALVLGPRTPILGSESGNLIDTNEPSVALGWTPGPGEVQRRPGQINLGLRGGKSSQPAMGWKRMQREAVWGRVILDVDGRGGQRHEARMSSTWGSGGVRSWDGRRGRRGSLATHSTGLESDRPGFKSWLCRFSLCNLGEAPSCLIARVCFPVKGP